MLKKVYLTRDDLNFAQVAEVLQSDGYALCSLIDSSEYDRDTALNLIDQVLANVAIPIQIFAQYPKWRPIGVDLTRNPSRSQGIGVSPPHMDFINAEDPPDIVVLYCERPDPAGGGNTTLVHTSVAQSLPLHFRQKLRNHCYADGQVVNLVNVGKDINPFAVLSEGQTWAFRYTDQLLYAALDDEASAAVGALHEAVQAKMINLPLHTGEAILIDQHRMLHGRLSLGGGQEKIPTDSRRLIWQRFGRKR